MLDTPNIKFPAIVAAVRARELGLVAANKGLWAIGDMCIAARGPPGEHGVNTGSNAKLEEVAAELEALGFKGYKLRFLQRLCEVAWAYEECTRVHSVPWSVHWVCGNPTQFVEVIEEADRLGHPLTVAFARQFQKQKQKRAEEDERRRQRDLSDPPTNPEVLRFGDDLDIAANDARENFRALVSRAKRLAADLSDEVRDDMDDKLDAVITAIEVLKESYRPPIAFAEAAE